MKKLIMITLVAGFVGCGTNLARAEETTRQAMRQKLDYAQGALEGLTLGKFDLVLTNAVRLRDFSQTNAFAVTRNVTYLNQTTNFSHRVDALLAAAKAGNLEQATQAYQDVTRSCIECHQLLRREQHFKGESDAGRK